MKINDIRKQAKILGYKIQFKTNLFNCELITIGFKYDGNKSTIGANCFNSEFYKQHNAIFEYIASLKDVILTDTEQRII